MARQNLEKLQQQQHREAAQTLVSGAARPPQRKTGTASAKHRVGTLSSPYERADGTRTIKINVNLSAELVGRLKSFLAVAEMQGVSRAEWIEAALANSIKTGFMPVRDEHADDEQAHDRRLSDDTSETT